MRSPSWPLPLIPLLAPRRHLVLGGLLGFLLPISLAGCSDGDGPTEPGTQPTIAVAPGTPSVTVTPGASNTVSVQITRSRGFDGTVSLSLEGAPDGLSGTFDPAPVPVGSASSTLSLSAAPAMASGTHNLTIRASGAGVEPATASLAVLVEAQAQGEWSALGQGMNRPVFAIVVNDQGNLYAGGVFTRAGGVTANHVAKWDGSSWRALGTGMSGGDETRVFALALDPDGNLYAGGEFTTAGGVEARSVAMWDGTNWHALGEPFSWSGVVQALEFDSEGTLYVGGSFRMSATPGGPLIENIARWDGSAWSGVAGVGVDRQGLNGVVSALAIDESDNVYVGGSFSSTAEPGASLSRIAMWNGQYWEPLGEGLGRDDALVLGSVGSLVHDGAGSLYAGGLLSIAGHTIDAIVAVWDGAQWSALAAGGTPAFPTAALEIDAEGRLYAGGYFMQSVGAPADFLATWNGTEWASLGPMLGPVHAIAADDVGNVYIGGGFTWLPYNGIARWRW